MSSVRKETAMTDKTPPEFNPETAPPSLTIDWDAYMPFVEDEDIFRRRQAPND
jgi:hypothetical protein